MPITELKASARSKKGWVTKKREHPSPVQVALGGGAAWATAKANTGRRLLRHQYEWKRPNGDSVAIRGFSPREIGQMSPGLQDIDKHLRPELHLKTESISRRRLGPMGTSMQAQAMYHPSLKDIPEVTSGELSRGVVITAQGITHVNDKGSISIAPRAARRGRGSSLAGLTQHELGHSLDYSGAAEGEKFSDRDKFFDATFEGEDARGYQASAPVEDFAETFRGTLGKVSGTTREVHLGPAEKAMSKLVTGEARDKMQQMYEPTLDANRINYMADTAFAKAPGEAGTILEKEGLHQQTNKFLLGAGLAAAGGYGAYEHIHDPHKGQLERWNKHKTTTK